MTFKTIFLQKRVVTTERAKFLSAMPGEGESGVGFLACFEEEARYCDFENFETVTNTEFVKKLSQG